MVNPKIFQKEKEMNKKSCEGEVRYECEKCGNLFKYKRVVEIHEESCKGILPKIKKKKKNIVLWLFLTVIMGILLGMYEVAYGEYETNLLIGIGVVGYIFYMVSKGFKERIAGLEKQIKTLKKR